MNGLVERDTYKEIRIFKFPGMVVRVHIPDLTDEENARRMKKVHDASAALLKEEMKKEAHKNVGSN